MSNVGKTRVPGHGLQGEGRWRVGPDGITPRLDRGGSAHCACGATSEPGISIPAAQRWHREHKETVRSMSA